MKIFIISNEGYASIRMTQRNYFGGEYVGCDVQCGLRFPRWAAFFSAFGIPVMEVETVGLESDGFRALFNAPGPAAFMVAVDPEQTYFPKITSRITARGSMESEPLHLMTPDLPDGLEEMVMPYFTAEVV